MVILTWIIKAKHVIIICFSRLIKSMNVSGGAKLEEPNAVIGVAGSSAENRENLTEFICENCKLSVKCRYGKLELEKAGYREECYYLRNPFEPPNFHKAQHEYTVDDFTVIGSKCFICEQQICVDEECSLFYKNSYCLKCIWRERHSFPEELISQVAKQKKKAEEIASDNS